MSYKLDNDGKYKKEIKLSISLTKDEFNKMLEDAKDVFGANDMEKVQNYLKEKLQSLVSG